MGKQNTGVIWVSINENINPPKNKKVVTIDDDFDSMRWNVAVWDGTIINEP